ncbi:MAG: multicopper oxidase family protein [Okeania sp. SIO3I5]|uniref:multicopper oxidase family protein n=1 Tax=Okeania sp. SIO3I5 TaxID=2607805 RepID=UPI0013BA6352|nr:multicopper oxidase family protein [Okeania sp. SIO3I5]NEQ36490.1 multicopper oxidase family protein [Okeania sp. SIO3I5]
MTQQSDEKKASENQEQDILSSPLGRRAFLSGFGLGAGITAASFIVFGATQNKTTLTGISPVSSLGETPVNGFPQPETIANGTPQSPAQLRVAQENINILGTNPRTELTRCFNGDVPGPTFRLQAGERVNIKLVNALPKNTTGTTDGTCPGTMDRPRCFNTTNLHFHGFHVSPMSIAPGGTIVSGGKNDEVEKSSDDVLYELEPSTTGGSTEHPYCVYLPTDHAPGTHWYHPHLHGSTAIQVVDGMAGALVIEDPPEDKIDVDQDLLWIIQEIIGNSDEDVYTCGGTSREFTVNGQSQPTLTIKPQELCRFRFINATATPRGFMTLKIQKCNSAECDINDVSDDSPWEDVVSNVDFTSGVFQIAVDGISHYQQPPTPMSSMLLSPANRADFLVKLEEGKYRVFKDTFPGVGATTQQTLASINVTGTPVSSPKDIPPTIPGDFPDYLKPFDTPNPEPAKTISFDRAGPSCFNKPPETVIPRKFEVDNKVYDPEPPNETVQNVDINTDEVWELTNTTGAAHPFHIHVNPFKVIECNGCTDEVDPTIWWDTFYIPPKNGQTNGSIKIRHRFNNYPGKFVFHCHVLIHEDLGMMQNVNVKGTGLAPCQPSGGETFTWNPESPSANA